MFHTTIYVIHVSGSGEVKWCINHDLTNIVTPMDVDVFKKLLIQSKFNKRQRIRIINGFRFGFPLCYEGDQNIKRFSLNLKLTVGMQTDLWNKVIKEVEGKRYAGPYLSPPFETFAQSPIGLVPKDKGTKTRLIFHLSYLKSGGSVNNGIPKDLCTVHYPDFENAV